MTSPTVVHVITGLAVGGAEMVLYRLLAHAAGRMGNVMVIGLRQDGPVGDMIRALGIPVVALDLGKDVRQVRGLGRLTSILMTARANVVQTWLYHADVLGGAAARRANARVVWGLHAGAPARGRAGLAMGIGVRLCARLSHHLPDRIVCSSHQAYAFHRGVGYVKDRMVVIPNGFEDPRPDRRRARQSLVEELRLEDHTTLVVRVGRVHPVKDHVGLLDAFSLVASDRPDVHLLLVGDGTLALAQHVGSLGLSHRVHLLGRRSDVETIVAGCDVAVSSSRSGEGLPLVIGEAMAVGTPVVATDVGDSAQLIGDPRRIVVPGDTRALAAVLEQLIQLDQHEREAIGARDRERILSGFGIEKMATSYIDLYEQISHG